MRARRTSTAIALAALALLTPGLAGPAAADTAPTLAIPDVTATEPAYGASTDLVFTPTLSSPVAGDVTFRLELFKRYPGSSTLFLPTGQADNVTVPAGSTTANAAFTITGDAYDSVNPYVYEARVSWFDGPAQLATATATARVTDTTRDGTFWCLTIPHSESAFGVGLPVYGMKYVDTLSGDPFTAECNNGARRRASYVSDDGSLEATDAAEYQQVAPEVARMYQTPPAVGDHAYGRAELGKVVLRTGGVTIAATGLWAEVRASCDAIGPEPTFTTASGVQTLDITTTVTVGTTVVAHTQHYVPGGLPLQIHVGSITVAVNDTTDERWPAAFPDQAGDTTRYVTRAGVVVRDDLLGPLAYLAGVDVATKDGNACDT